MNLSQRHQAVFDEKFPDGYAIKKVTLPDGKVIDEADFYHIMYIDIREDGKRTRDVPCVQKYSVKDWEGTKRVLQKYGITVTGHDEYAIIHDPKAAIAARDAESKAKEAKAEENKKKAEVMRVAKAEKAEAKREAEAKVKPESKEAPK